MRGNLYKKRNYEDSRAPFIDYTTLSAAQLKEKSYKSYKLTFGNQTRNKNIHLDDMHKRFNTRETEESFTRESIRGMNDVVKQQLPQGTIGFISRVAKVATMTFFRPCEGGLHVIQRNGIKCILDDKRRDSGVPATRGISILCSMLQQSALFHSRLPQKPKFLWLLPPIDSRRLHVFLYHLTASSVRGTSCSSSTSSQCSRTTLPHLCKFRFWAWLTTIPSKDGPTASKALSQFLVSLGVKYTETTRCTGPPVQIQPPALDGATRWLGVYFDRKLTFKNHARIMASRATKTAQD